MKTSTVSNQTYYVIFSIVILIGVFYLSKKNVQNFHPGKLQESGDDDVSTQEKLISLSNKIQEYIESSTSMSNTEKKQKIAVLGMESHHLDEMETKNKKINSIAKLLHKNVTHDLLQIQYVLDSILMIGDESELNRQEKYESLMKEIEDTPDKNFNPESKEKLVKIIKRIA
jgi:hypothetical protein